MKRLKYAAVAALAAIGISTVTACGSPAIGQYQTVCINPATGLRDYDYACSATLNPLWLYYLPYGALAPAYGYHAAYGTFTRPNNVTVVYGGVPTTGGKVNPPKTAKAVKIPAAKSTSKPTSKSTSKNKTTTTKNGGGSKVNLNKPRTYKAPSVRVGRR